MVFGSADAATDLADIPLTNATTATVLPNIAFVLDDSASMGDENMPDDGTANFGKYCYKWYKYNTLAYNPGQTYLPPIKADGSRYPNASFTAALRDGYFAVGALQFDGLSANSTVNLSIASSPPIYGVYYATHNTDPNSTTCETNSKYTVVTTSANIAAPGVPTGSVEARTNYANWYSYYRKRAFLMKAGVGEAFAKLVQDKFRIGLFFINSVESGAGSANNDLAINTFSGTHRDTWFSRVYGMRRGSFTPLRGALSRMGRMYAGKINGWDPVQYSCQRNYTILSTDGYWNNFSETPTYGPKQLDGSTNVGDRDGVAGVTRPSLDVFNASNTLADVAYYYYHTDLRPGSCASPDVCTDNVPVSGVDPAADDVAKHQHMTTFTVGLGVDGTLDYQENYKKSTSGDYYDIVNGTKNWPNPMDAIDKDRIDDLWHAAVNGRGTYFSAKDPITLAKGLAATLKSIDTKKGGGAAVASSSLQPTTDDNEIYIASYQTVQWDGDVAAYTIDLSSGALSALPTWSAATLLADRIASNGEADTRTIYTADGNTRTLFNEAESGGLTPTQLAYFDNSKLSQYADWSPSQKTQATPARLVNYLRGHGSHEESASLENRRLYRDRSNILGGIIHSQPVYVKAPPHNFADAGYGAFKTANDERLPTLYVAANDGMLHAFDATSGEERWAYVPPVVLPEMWRLADATYNDNHRFYLDGPLTVSDAYIGGEWKTVLIGALGKGGRGYYALDVTNPTDPKPLWNFSASDDNNVGYSYGPPFITKLADGTWVALLTSGYNNIPEDGKYSSADGKGYVFVLNLANGHILKKISTEVGSVANPSGLARINIAVSNFATDNTALAAYGGDLLGNMWRFDLEGGTASKLANFGSSKPIMAGPEIGEVYGKKVVFFGTGRYLGEDDLSDTSQQSIYAIKDDGTTTVSNTSQLVEQSVIETGDTRSISANSVDWTTKFGWYINLPTNGERIAIEPQLYFGTLVVASIVPTTSECVSGGYSWLYQLDYRTGGDISGLDKPAGTKFASSAIVGLTVVNLSPGSGPGSTSGNGNPVIYPRFPEDPLAPVPLDSLPFGGAGAVKRILWRTLPD